MSDVAIRVEDLGKRYRIGEKQASYRNIREVLTSAATSPFKKAYSLMRGQAYGAAGLKEEIWALRGVSFDVKKGEALGIIGPNGAGKTTLLKILSRITEPAEGRAEVYGKVGSLLEVGIGMHAELTGRENIYLNGAILGMKRAEIVKAFDEIVEFSGVETFIDTPTKHYSSGMQVRLAFSVAAHLNPEILLIDEVLAVGDVEFQKKCLGKMNELASGGRTVLFVSHNMAAVRRLCSRAICLIEGRVAEEGGVDEVVDRYLATISLEREMEMIIADLRHFENLNVSISPTDGGAILPLHPVEIRVSFAPKEDMINGIVYAAVHTNDDTLLFGFGSSEFCVCPNAAPGERAEVVFNIMEMPLMPGEYFLRIHLLNPAVDAIEIVDKRFGFRVEEGREHMTSRLAPHWRGNIAIRVDARFEVKGHGIND